MVKGWGNVGRACGREPRRLALLALAAGLVSTAAACTGNGGQTSVKVVVDARGLAPADQDRIRAVEIVVDGDGDGGHVTQRFQIPGLEAGQYEILIRPRSSSGTLQIHITVEDANGVPLAAGDARVNVRQGRQSVVVVALGHPDGGVPDADGGAGVTEAGSDGGGGNEDGDGSDGDGSSTGPGDGDICATAACSGADSDGCCPTGCSAVTDSDCAGCGNGRIETPLGETCDPLQSCPDECPQMGCQLYTLSQPGTCQAACTPSRMQTACVNGDDCCPSGCNNTNDTDCPAVCGNGVVEPGEMCDGDCPSKCDPVGCQLRSLQGGVATCDARCVNGSLQTVCQTGDGCCPSACNATSDGDCAVRCGNGVLETGETCDGNCPTSCPPMGCQLRVLQGSAAACDVQCSNGALQTACLNNDGCCPAPCNSTNDNDCTPSCGNGILERGETCDPPSACATVAAACVNDANNIVTTAGSAANCTFACTRRPRPCGTADTFCPTTVACGPATDVDCPGCGNGRIETARGETCDPPSMCMTQMTACVSDANNVRVSSGSVAACTYRCTTTPRACGPADGFCPTGCGPTMDVDCPGCGNGRIETALGETCDVAPAATPCPATCDDGDPCTTDSRTGTTAACNVVCGHTAITVCGNGDACCPRGCNATNDNACGAVCGNGVIELGETCDPVSMCTTQMTACVSDANNVRTPSGSTANCTFRCTTTPRACGPADGFCPTGCGPAMDVDCPGCGNGRIETALGETCDPPSMCLTQMTACVSDANNVRTSSGVVAACTYRCTVTPRACGPADGFCPTGCLPTRDVDCPGCGNGRVEPGLGETCDVAPAPACPASCADTDACTTDTRTGTDAQCNVACTHTAITACLDNDKCCPAGCTELNDNDCLPSNDLCANALDISAGGDFPFSLIGAKEEVPSTCLANLVAPDVYFRIQLASPSALYLDVYEGDTGLPVNVELELFNTCPVAGTKPLTCNSTGGMQACGGNGPWPRIVSTNTDLTTFIVAARVINGAPGRHTLRFQRVPLTCIGAGLLPAAGMSATGTTCTQQDLFTPTCAGQSGAQDRTYWLPKCPLPAINVNTCARESLSTDTILQIFEGSLDLQPTTTGAPRCVIGPKGRAIACNDDAPATAPCTVAGLAVPNASNIAGAARGERGLFTITVADFGLPPPTGQNCGNYLLNVTP